MIDQNTQVIKTKQKRGWFPVNSRPRPAVSGGQACLNLLGAVTDDGDRFISFVEGRFTGKVAAHFLRALQEEFGKNLVIVLDNAPYFIAKHLKKQAARVICVSYEPQFSVGTAAVPLQCCLLICQSFTSLFWKGPVLSQTTPGRARGLSAPLRRILRRFRPGQIA